MATVLEQIEYEESTVKDWKNSGKAKVTMEKSVESSMVKQRLVEVTEKVKELAENHAGTAGRYNKILFDSVVDKDWMTVAYIGITETLKTVGHDKNSLQMVIHGIGTQLEEHYRLTLFETEHKDEVEQLKKSLKKRKSTDTAHARRLLNHHMKKQKMNWEFWDIETKAHLGARVLRVILEVYDDVFEVEEIQEGKKTKNRIKVTEEFTNWKKAFIDFRSEWITPPKPLKVQALNWSDEGDGGFHTERLKVPKVKCRGKVHESKIKSMPEVDAALNKQQAVKWVINKGMLQRVQEVLNSEVFKGIKNLQETKHTKLEDYLRRKNGELTEEMRKEKTTWKKSEKDAHEDNIKVTARMLRISRTVKLAVELADWEELYFVYNCDLVGRMYCNSEGLNTQGGDLEKSLLDFKKQYKVSKEGRRWLQITTGKYFGIKGSEEQLLKWYKENEEKIKAVRDDWNVEWWTKAKKPWLFLRICTEVFEEYSGMPVPVDGVCNGLQHYAAMMRCKKTAENLGMITGEPSDVYTLVKEALEKIYDTQDWLVRDFAKTPVMLVAYGITKGSMLRLIWATLGGDVSYAESNQIGQNLWDALNDIIGAALEGMEILKQEYKEGFMEWVSPTGFVCYQPYEKLDTIVIKLTLSNSVRINMKKGTGVPSVRKQRSAYPANKIHSMDAAHAVRIVNNTKTEIRCTHDEFAVHCNRVLDLQETIREEFIKLYENVKLKDGDLDLEQIRRKKYFFY
jgi:DNA-directed RNA polymerase